MDQVGRNIKYYRTKAGLTQDQLAKKVNRSRAGISDMERGIFPPSIKTLELISKALNIDLDKFFQA